MNTIDSLISKFTPENWISLASAIIALSSAAASIIFANKSHKHSSTTLTIDTMSYFLEYFRDIREWSNKVIETMEQCRFLCYIDPNNKSSIDFYIERAKLISKLSTLLDQGRFFFPNKEAEHGLHKLFANQGIKHDVLEEVENAYKIALKLDYKKQEHNSSLKTEIVACKKRFVNHVFIAIEPKKQYSFHIHTSSQR